LDQSIIEYIQSLIPRDFPDGRVLLKEGLEIGKSITVEPNLFLKKYGYKNYLEYRKDCASKGKIVWQLLVGLSTLEEELEAIKKLDEFSDRTGFDIRTVQSIPNMLVGLPPEYWEKTPKSTSYLMRGEEDWMAHSNAAPIQTLWQDWHLSSPNNLKTTIYAIKAGTARVGTFSQFIWDYPGYTDEEKRLCDMVRSLGILAAKREDFITADTYAEDGMPGYFLDVASYVGYMLVEHYIIEKLCGAKMSISFGGLLTEIQPRIAFAMAMHKLLGTEEEPILSYFNGGTVEQWDHDIEANYGTGVQEMLIEILAELKYKMHAAVSPVSITEKLRVPTLHELFNIAAAGKRVEEKAREWLPLINFAPLEELRDDLIDKGTKFYNNIMHAFEKAGVDMYDPLQIITVLKRFNPVKFELSFHPSVEEHGVFTPYHPSVIGRQTLYESRRIIGELKQKGFAGALKGKKIIAVSADGHSYGLMSVETVLAAFDAMVINGGVDFAPADVLDLADEEGTDMIFISVHIGQVLDFCRQLSELSAKRKKKYQVYIGGKLNAILPGHSEPVDITDQLRSMGFFASNDYSEIFNIIGNQKN
jgi:methylmalonyl-CoA mutase cobalamin-binding subunit